MEGKFSFLLFIIAILDIYFNYHINDFPQYHKTRLYSGILTLASILIPFLFVMFICLFSSFLFCQLINNNHMNSCTNFFKIISSILVFNLSLGSLIFQIYSIYLYLVKGGNNKIQSVMIKILLPLYLISIIIKSFFAGRNLMITIQNKKKSDNNENNEELTDTELQEQNEE